MGQATFQAMRQLTQRAAGPSHSSCTPERALWHPLRMDSTAPHTPPTRKRTTRAGKSPGRTGEALGSFCAWDGDTLVVNVLGKPAAARDAIGKPTGHQLNISVTEPPVRGRATDHMVRYLAKRFGVTPAHITVVFGRFNVNKQLRIHAPQKLPAVVAKHLGG